MRRTGIWLIVFGVLNFALPRIGYDLTWFEYLGKARTPGAIGLIALGTALVVAGSRRRRAR